MIWAKNTFTLGRSDCQRQHESILYGWKAGGPHFWCGDRDQEDVWSVAKPVVNDLHPTMKPVELVERAIRNSSRPGDLVLDAFGGSGSTLIACERLDRKARILELEPKNVDVIVRRWQEFTGRSAVLAAEVRSISEVSELRVGTSPQMSRTIDFNLRRKRNGGNGTLRLPPATFSAVLFEFFINLWLCRRELLARIKI